MYYQGLLDDFVDMCREVIGEGAGGEPIDGKDVRIAGEKSRLTGVYLHGSMAMGCFNPEKSDIDIIVVIEGELTDGQKMRFMERVVQLNGRAPEKGLELSVVKRCYCKPFAYPTPYELHFSPAHLWWFRERPEHYVENMKGADRDLAAHFTVINRYGIALYGEAVSDVFGEVPKRDYLDSIWHDVENAAEDIEGNPVYVILNLCRSAAFLRDGLCLSKEAGGEWGLESLSARYRGLILGALGSYRNVRAGAEGGLREAGGSVMEGGLREAGELCGAEGLAEIMQADRELAREFAESMVGEIRAGWQACAGE